MDHFKMSHARWKYNDCKRKGHEVADGYRWLLCQTCHYGYMLSPGLWGGEDILLLQPKLLSEEEMKAVIEFVKSTKPSYCTWKH